MSIGIVGGGTAGLQLALLLQRDGVDSTLYAERSADEVRKGRLPNTVVHNHRTRARERAIGANLWDGTAPDIAGHWHSLAMEPRIDFPGFFSNPSLAVDYRIYQADLLEAYEDRGGKVEVGAIAVEELGRLGERHELLVVATGRGGLGGLFLPIPERSPFSQPMRLLAAGLFTGVAATPDHNYVVLSLGSPHGEIINIPMESFGGNVAVILFECIPGGDLDAVAKTPYADDPQGWERLVLEAVRDHHPRVFERIDESEFGLTDPSSVLQGALTPTVRQGYTQLDGGTYAIACGDVHVTLDPVCGLGANAASLSAFAVGETIAEGGPFDEAFCKRVDEKRLPGVLAHFDFTNFMLHPRPYIGDVMGAMSQNPELSNDFTEGFTEPWRQWANMQSAEACSAYLTSFQ